LAKKSGHAAIKVRPATHADAERIAQLSTQLGYPSTRQAIARRLSHIGCNRDHAVYVATASEGRVLGWVHVFVHAVIESNPEAEVGGLVVDDAYRGSGVGRLLMQQAEEWALKNGLRSVYLRSNVIRKDAHAFYQKLGYKILKTQYAFRKPVGAHLKRRARKA
jgi:GNAT superfamily N-acetyltransferase